MNEKGRKKRKTTTKNILANLRGEGILPKKVDRRHTYNDVG